MASIKQTLFEDPTAIYIVLGLAELALAALWFYRRTVWSQRLLVAPLLLAAGVFALDALIVTDREQIMETVEVMAEDFETGQMENIDQYIDEAYVGFRAESKKQLVAALRNEQENRNVESIKVTSMELDVSGRSATMYVTTIIGWRGNRIPLRWTLYWVKRDETWRIRGAEEPQRTVTFGI
jgi:hypothetical protein